MQYQYESNQSQRNQNSISERIKQSSTKSKSSNVQVPALKKVSDRLSCAQEKSNKYLEKNEESLNNISQILEDLEEIQIPQLQIPVFQQKMHIIDSSSTPRSPFKKQQDFSYQIENSINKIQFPSQSKQDLILNEIQNKMNFLLQQGENSIDRQLKYMNNKVQQKNYYPFIKENNQVILKILIMILYDELEKFYIIDNGSTVTFRLQIENLEKTIQKLNEEISEKNIKITNLNLNQKYNSNQSIQDQYTSNNTKINTRQSIIEASSRTPTRERVSSNFSLKQSITPINTFDNIKFQLSNIEDEYQSQQDTLQQQLDNQKKIYYEIQKKNEYIKDQYDKLEQQFIFYKQNTCELSAFQNINNEIKSLQIELEKQQKCNIQLEKNNQNLISQQLDIQNIKLEKNKFQNSLSFLQSENDKLKQEQQEFFELLTNCKTNLENIKKENNNKEQEKQAIQLKYKESLNEINILQQKIHGASHEINTLQTKIQNNQHMEEDINTQIECYKTFFDNDFQQKQIQILDELQMFFMNQQNSNIETIDNQLKQMIRNVYGDRFLKIIEFLSSIIQNNQQNYIRIVQKHHETLQEKLISQEDIVFLGQTMLKACEIFSRQQNNKLPTDVLMVREDFEQKKTIIYDKIRDANNSIKLIHEYLQKVNMDGDILTKNNDLQQWSERINNLDYLDTQQEQSRLSIAEKFQIQEYQNENLLLKQRIDALVDQLMLLKRNDNGIKSQNQKFLKSERSVSSFNETVELKNYNQTNQQSDDEMVSMLFMQATSIEQLINVKR